MMRMDIRRILKSKSFYISLFLLLALLVICICQQNPLKLSYTDANDVKHAVGIYTSVDALVDTPLSIMYHFARSYIFLIFGIFMVLFVCSEYSSGYIKNSCMMYKSRAAIIFNKLCITCFLSIVVVLVSFAFSTLLGFLIMDGFHFGDAGDLLLYLGMLILMNMAYFSLITLLCTMTHNKTVGIIVVFLIATAFSTIFLQPLFDMIGLSDMMNYTLSRLMMSIPMQYDHTQMLRITVMSITYVVVYHLGALLIVLKRDF